MDKKELGGMLKGKLQEATDAVKNAAKDAKIPEVKMPEIKKPDIKVPDQVKNVFKKKDESNESSTEETAEEKKEYSRSEIEMVKGISPLNAVKVFYYLMVADGNIEKKLEKFNSFSNRARMRNLHSSEERLILNLTNIRNMS